MKRTLYILLSSFITLILGAILLIPVNEWIWEAKGLKGGYDDEMKMFDVLVFIEWPILIIAGGILGNYLYKKSSNRVTGDL